MFEYFPNEYLHIKIILCWKFDNKILDMWYNNLHPGVHLEIEPHFLYSCLIIREIIFLKHHYFWKATLTIKQIKHNNYLNQVPSIDYIMALTISWVWRYGANVWIKFGYSSYLAFLKISSFLFQNNISNHELLSRCVVIAGLS